MKRSVIYKQIRDHAKREIQGLKFIDLQKGQMMNPRQNFPLPLPALLVEFREFRFSNILEHHQKGDGLISLYLYLDLVTDSFNDARSENDAIEILDKQDEVFQVFEDFPIHNGSPLVRQAISPPQYGNRFIMFRVDFQTTIDDHKVMECRTAKRPDPNIKYSF